MMKGENTKLKEQLPQKKSIFYSWLQLIWFSLSYGLKTFERDPKRLLCSETISHAADLSRRKSPFSNRVSRDVRLALNDFPLSADEHNSSFPRRSLLRYRSTMRKSFRVQPLRRDLNMQFCEAPAGS